MTLSKDPAERALAALRQFVAGNEVPVYELARLDHEALAVINGLPVQYPVTAVRNPLPGEVVDASRQFLNGSVFCSCTAGDVQYAIRVLLARDAARSAALAAMAVEEEPAFLDHIDGDSPLPQWVCVRSQ